jgi:hypothetical protein
MELCARVDDIVWGDSDLVWDETFMLITRGTLGRSQVLNEIIQWILSRVTEYEVKYLKVVSIHDKLDDPSEEGVRRLMLHYRDLMLRYKMAYDSCKTVDLIM